MPESTFDTLTIASPVRSVSDQATLREAALTKHFLKWNLRLRNALSNPGHQL